MYIYEYITLLLYQLVFFTFPGAKSFNQMICTCGVNSFTESAKYSGPPQTPSLGPSVQTVKQWWAFKTTKSITFPSFPIFTGDQTPVPPLPPSYSTFSVHTLYNKTLVNCIVPNDTVLFIKIMI